MKKGLLWVCLTGILLASFAYARPSQTFTNENTEKAVVLAASGLKTVKVVVALPFTRKGIGFGMVDFYRGFLIAVDSMKHAGISVGVDAFDSDGVLSDILDAAVNADLVICPSDSGQVAAISQATNREGIEKNIKVVSPFYRWSLEMESNPNFFALNPPLRIEDEVTLALLRAMETGSRIVLVETDKKETSFAAKLKREVSDLRVVTEQEGTTGMSSILKEIDGRNVVVLSSNDQPSLNILLSTLSQLRHAEPDLDFCLLGYGTWLNYATNGGTNMLEDFFTVDTYLSSQYHLDTGGRLWDKVNREWIANFDEPMPVGYPALSAYGFDVGMFFLQGMVVYGQDFGAEQVYSAPLQHRLSFERLGEGQGFVNKGINLIHYDRSHGVSLIAVDR